MMKSAEPEYDPPGATWLNATMIGFIYGVEMDASRAAHYRYRRRDPMSGMGIGPWMKGYPDDPSG